MQYCERCGPGLLDEPVNALTNVAFLLAAWCAWRLARRRGRLSAGIRVLLGLVVAVGIGSGLWHTFATRWAEVLDRAPIALFQLAFLWLYLRGVVGLRRPLATALLGGFFVLSVLATLLPPVLNRSLLYAPAFLVLVGLGIYHYRQRKRERGILLAAAGVFLAALVFRTVDMLVCPVFPVGTHFLWHALNGLNVYLAMRCLIANPPDAATV